MALEINFAGKKVLVTGTGSGIGRDLCIALHKQGALVFAVSKSPERLATLADECSGLRTICVDLEDWDATRGALKDLEVMDALVNNAGMVIEETFTQFTPEVFDKTMNINLKAAINVSQLVAAKMIESNRGGSIVNVSSLASKCGTRTSLAYNLSKAALDMLTKSMAVELGPKKIRVNSVNPGIVMTSMGKYFYEKEPGITIKKAVLGRTPLGKICETSDVVNTILFLLSDLAPMIHGEIVFLDGAYSAA